MNQETKLGLFVLLGLAALAVSVILLGDFQFQSSYYLNVIFNDISSLPDKADVRIAGVTVGAVKKITLEENHAKVKIWIRTGVKVHKGAEASIASTGVIGTKYMEITAGDLTAPLLQDGDTITGNEALSIEKMAGNIMKQLDKVFSSFQGPNGESIGKNLYATVANLRKVTDALKVAVADQETKVVDIVNNIHSFTGDLAQITADNKEALKVAIKNIRDVSEKFDHVITKIDKGEGTIGKLVSDPKMGEDLKDTFKELKETSKQANHALRRLNMIETRWEYTRRYDTKYSFWRNDVGLRIIPVPGKFYYIGASNLGENEGATGGDYETFNTFNLLVGKQFGPIEAYAGAIRSKGGIGMNVKPFYKWDPLSRFEITAEGYHFSRVNPVGKPVVNVGARVQLAEWGYAGAQVEDLYYSSALNAYVHLSFKDDDIAYILGLVGLARP